MYYRALQQISKTLRNLAMILDKAERHAAGKKFDSGNFLTQRLAPDMFPLVRQVQVACDVAKGAAAMFSNREVPRHEDSEKTIAELKQRINVTVAFVESVKEPDTAHLNDKSKVHLTYPQGKGMLAHDALFQRVLPNFFFHVATSYGLLRQGGVEVGKMDYLGELAMFDL
jgi:hypothetical protein